MKKFGMLLAGIMLVSQSAVFAADPMNIDFHWSFKQRAAQNLFGAKKYDEAVKALDELAATAPSPRLKADVMALAALSLANKGEYDQAMARVDKITEVPVADFARMEIMMVSDKQDALIAMFKDQDMTGWPEDLAYQGYLARGNAYEKLEDMPAAVSDWEQVVSLSDHLGGRNEAVVVETLNRIASAYRAMDDNDKALSFYLRSAEIAEANTRARGRAGREFYGALVSAARLLAAQSKYDEAQALLAKFDPAS
ncbi:MAG: tetratricopeptide repeat protein, partial [Kiritimatiellia bacterium]